MERFKRQVNYMKFFKTLRWIDVFDKLMNYNSVHNRTEYTPNKVNAKNANEIRNKEKESSGAHMMLLLHFKLVIG